MVFVNFKLKTRLHTLFWVYFVDDDDDDDDNDNKLGHINANIEKALNRLNIEENICLKLTGIFETYFYLIVNNLPKFSEHLNYQRPS